MIDRIQYTPIALFGCPFGLSGLTLATFQVEATEGLNHLAGGLLLVITMTVFVMVLSAYAIKAVSFSATALSDWKHPVRTNFFAVISGTFALLGLAILPFSSGAALPI